MDFFFRHYKIVRLFIWAYPLHDMFNMPCLAWWYSVLGQAFLSCSIASPDIGILLIFKKGRLRSWSKEAYISQKFLLDFCLYLILVWWRMGKLQSLLKMWVFSILSFYIGNRQGKTVRVLQAMSHEKWLQMSSIFN